jgi:hypothetical protein
MLARALHTPPEPRVQRQFGLMLLPVHLLLHIGPTLVGGDSLRHAVAANPLGQEALADEWEFATESRMALSTFSWYGE